MHTESVSPEHRYCRSMALLTEAEMNDFADRLLAAIGAADEVALREVYDPQAAVWHNFDERDQTVDENLAMLHDMHRRLRECTARRSSGARSFQNAFGIEFVSDTDARVTQMGDDRDRLSRGEGSAASSPTARSRAADTRCRCC